mgnify:CR=1 FL=1
MNYIKNIYRPYIKDYKFIVSFFISLLMLVSALVVNFYAGTYATGKASNSVTDIVLSNIRVFNVDGIFVYGAIIFWIFIALLCALEPKRIPFIFKSTSLFVLIRSVFISLTHIGPFPSQIVINSNLLAKFTPGGDLFFSAHVGLPFLLALIFWENARIRFICVASAVIFGVVVLMGHLHYSIDVLAAFFITYTIYRIACAFFPKDKKIFTSGLESEN